MRGLGLLLFDRKPQGKRGSFSKLAGGVNAAVMQFDDILHDGQAQPGSPGSPLRRRALSAL